MKKSRKTLLTALTLMSSVSMTSCYAVYGPPPDEDISVSSPENSISAEESLNEYNTGLEEMQCVYGPPPDMEEK